MSPVTRALLLAFVVVAFALLMAYGAAVLHERSEDRKAGRAPKTSAFREWWERVWSGNPNHWL